MLQNPLYRDMPRIDDYLSQFSSLDASERDFGSKFGVGGHTGITAEISQVPYRRPKLDHEKATEFVRHLATHNQLKQGRPTGLGPFPDPDFWHDTFRAHQILIRTDSPSATDSDHIILWIAEKQTHFSTEAPKPALYLIQEYGSGGSREFPRLWTGYARLKALIKAFRQTLSRTSLPTAISDMEKHDAEALVLLHGFEPEFLSKIGATEMSVRNVDVIYQLRDVNDDSVSGRSVYGYPIIITAAAQY